MKQKGSVIVLFLVFTYVVSCVSSVPVTRSLKSIEDKTSSVQSFYFQEKREWNEEIINIEGRKDLETTDYPGTGANNRHDPKNPGRP